MRDDRIIPEIEYKEYFDFVNLNKDKLFLIHFEIVQLKSFIISPHDGELCYNVLIFKNDDERGSFFYYQEVSILIGLIPIETLPHYQDIQLLWDLNLDRIGIEER